MLAELKDLVQKGLFTQVSPVTVDFEAMLMNHIARNKADHEEAHRI